MNNITEYLRQIIREYDSTLDIREGSALSDLMINPTAAILSDLKAQQDKLFKYQTLADPTSMDEDTLDTYASSYLVNRIEGDLARGYVRLYFNTPKTVYVPKNTYFQSTRGFKYKSTQGYTFTENQIRMNDSQYPYYSTGDIAVEAEKPGVYYDADPGEVNSLITSTHILPSYVSNPASIAGAKEHDDNATLYTKIINSAINKTIYSTIGIQTALQEQYPTIKNIRIMGMGNSSMKRDLVYSYNLASGLTRNGLYEKSDYFGNLGPISSGFITTGILSSDFGHFAPFNESVAYYNNIVSSGLITSGFLNTDINVQTAAFTGSEISLNQYAGLYANDSSYSIAETSIILDEEFANDNLRNLGWTVSDPSAGLNNLRYHNEVEVEDGELRLGYKPPSAGIAEPLTIVVDDTIITRVRRLIRRAARLGPMHVAEED